MLLLGALDQEHLGALVAFAQHHRHGRARDPVEQHRRVLGQSAADLGHLDHRPEDTGTRYSPRMLQPALPDEARRILALAQRDRAAARKALAELSLEGQVALVCESPAGRRSELLMLVPQPEEVIPRLPPAELCFTAKAIGLGDAGWVLEHATEEQIVACFDLDAWGLTAPDRPQLDAWLAALVDAGEEPLLRAARGLDLELLVLQMKARAQVILKPNDDSWSPPDGGITIDGQFYLVPLRDDDDFADLRALLTALFQHDYWIYFRLLQGAEWELESDSEEWALRWREGRLQDLGFPPLADAKRVYAHVREDRLAALPEGERYHPLGEWRLPVWMPRLPIGLDEERAVFRALAALPEDERRPHLFAFLALANRVAVADELSLGDADTLPLALEKAALLASRGLEHVARENGLELHEVLRRVALERLFRVGYQLARAEPAAQDAAEK